MMTGLSRSQLTGLAQSVGFTGSDVQVAVAVAFAESGGNPGATNMKGRDESYGLWQINMEGPLGPDRRRKFGITDNYQLLQPAVNAKAARIIHKESGWYAWSTFQDGAYKEFMTKDPVPSTGAIPNTPGKVGAPQEVTVDTTSQSDGIFNLSGLNAISAALTKASVNVSGYMIAVVLGIVGILLLLRNVLPVPPVAKVLKGVAK